MTRLGVSIQKEQANQIIQKHFLERGLAVHEVYEIDSHRFSYTAETRSFALDLTSSNSDASSSRSATHSCFLTVAIPNDASTKSTKNHHTNALPVIHQLINKIRTQTEIPILDSTLDTSHSVLPYDFLLSPPTPVPFSRMVPLSEVRASGNLSEKDIVLVELLLGKFLGQLHSGVQNDWYGLPVCSTEEPKDPSYNWQETFTLWLEELLDEVEGSKGSGFLPFKELRTYLSRAIGSFLFDDVEVPSLVWFTGSEDDIYLTLPSTSSPDGTSAHPPMIAAILPNVAHAIWGDPLLESIFLPPHPSDALKEGYKSGGGSPMLLFARQKTKRIWYTIFLALLVLTERGGETAGTGSKTEWAVETLKQCVNDLKDAPTY